jgi:hypothetical protein
MERLVSLLAVNLCHLIGRLKPLHTKIPLSHGYNEENLPTR